MQSTKSIMLLLLLVSHICRQAFLLILQAAQRITISSTLYHLHLEGVGRGGTCLLSILPHGEESATKLAAAPA